MRLARAALGLVLLGGTDAACAADAAPSPRALAYFSREEIARGAARAGQARRWWAATFVWSLAVLGALAHPAIGGAFVALAARLARAGADASRARQVAAAAAAIVLMLGTYLLLRGPFVWVRGYFHEHAWGLSTQSAGSFLADWLKMGAITLAVYLVALGGIAVLRAHLPRWWAPAAWGAGACLTVFMVFVWPVLVDPLFHRFTPVGEGDVRARAQRIAADAGIAAGEILWVDASLRTRRTNAYFTGLGATKRIVLYDTLRGPGGSLSPEGIDELETILAHEAGHWRHGHMWKGTLLAVAGMGAFFLLLWLAFRTGLRWLPPAALPAGARAAPLIVAMAMVLELASLPFVNAISRRWERVADRESLALSGKPEAFIRAEVELARRNIADIEPGTLTVFWFYTHPPVLERIAMGEAHLAAMRGAPARGDESAGRHEPGGQ